MKQEENNSKLDKEKGKRLRLCRERNNLTQEQFAEKIDVTDKYVSMLETGKRKISQEKAKEYAELLDVNPDYIMLKSDIIEPNKAFFFEALEDECYELSDQLLILYMLSVGYNIKFHVIKIYNSDIKPKAFKLTSVGGSCISYASITQTVNFSDLKGVNFNNNHCKLRENSEISEVIITNVTINDTKMSFGEFCFYIDQITNNIDSLLNNIPKTHESLNNIGLIDNHTKSELIEEKDLYNFYPPDRLGYIPKIKIQKRKKNDN
ncbi:helix-turn-helix domain-containing protein [Butyrivibrio sp. AE2015]|uniref:helix-turn-helix domain-containing protein n=1 Tax=Butyrivibrio sp. AE2015 TaxID=1280663 RepID=UPI0003B6543C|nr:helix-turn-helix transcriptional regulator [Butyrivibrio sp. AE2015]